MVGIPHLSRLDNPASPKEHPPWMPPPEWLEPTLDRKDARRHVGDCERDLELAQERGDRDAENAAKRNLGRARHDLERPGYHRPTLFGFVRREHQVTLPAIPVRIVAPMRMPRSRGAAHRPGARTAARAGPAPADDPHEHEPPGAAAAEEWAA